MESGFFEQVRDAFEGFVASIGGDLHTYAHGRGVKAWFSDDIKEHYEAQLIRTANGVQLEIGFHAEHSKEALNRQVVERFVSQQESWRPELGDDAEVGEFVGRAGWQRISEVVAAPADDDVDELIEIAARLADYVLALEPLRRRSSTAD